MGHQALKWETVGSSGLEHWGQAGSMDDMPREGAGRCRQCHWCSSSSEPQETVYGCEPEGYTSRLVQSCNSLVGDVVQG